MKTKPEPGRRVRIYGQGDAECPPYYKDGTVKRCRGDVVEVMMDCDETIWTEHYRNVVALKPRPKKPESRTFYVLFDQDHQPLRIFSTALLAKTYLDFYAGQYLKLVKELD